MSKGPGSVSWNESGSLIPIEHSVLNVGTFNKEKALVGAFAVIVNSSRRFVGSPTVCCVWFCCLPWDCLSEWCYEC